VRRAGLYFGSFNPIHNAHLSIAKYVLNNGHVDEVWLIVSPQSPFKKADELLPFEHRLRMAQLVAEDTKGLFVSDIELSMPVPSYTINTLEELSIRHPKTEFLIMLGGDNLAGIKGWKRYEEILDGYSILCYSRAKANLNIIENRKSITILDAPLLDVSSTNIRGRIAKGLDVRAVLHPAVYEYLMENNLFE
jgi:nicotinate-nucleotide adenylyltransferase